MELARSRKYVLLILCLVCLVFIAADNLATVQYSLDWCTVDGGGGALQGGGMSLEASLGQPDTGVLSGGIYSLESGFWLGGESPPTRRTIYLPIIAH